MTEAPSILVIGEALIDIVEQSDGARSGHVGGSPANVAVGLSRLGQEARLLTSFGGDAYGDQIQSHLDEAGVALVEGSRSSGATSTAEARLDSTGAATYTFDITWQLPVAPVIEPPLALHTGSIAAFLEPGATHVRALLESWAPSASISFDPNIRPALVGDHDGALATVEQFLTLSDVVKVSDEDLGWLYPDRSARDIAREWLSRGPAVIFVTLGAKGAFAISAQAAIEITSVPVTVVDTVGAGDAFMAGLIDGLVREGLLGADRREALQAIDAETLTRVGQHAATVARLTVAQAGAEPPTRAEVLAAS